MALFTRAVTHRGEVSVGWRVHVPMWLRSLAAFGAITAIVFLVAVRDAETTGSWYASLTKSKIEPPPEMFGRIWAGVFAAMTLGAWFVWRCHGSRFERSRALAIFAVQLVISAVWAPVLFGAQNPELALLVVAALWLAVLGTLTTFAPVSPWAAILLLPWFGWVTYVAALNVGIVLLN